MRGTSRVELYGVLILSPHPESGELVIASSDSDGNTCATMAVSHSDSVHRDFWQIRVENRDRNAKLAGMQRQLHALTAGEKVKVIGEPYIESGPQGKIPVVKPTAIEIVNLHD